METSLVPLADELHLAMVYSQMPMMILLDLSVALDMSGPCIQNTSNIDCVLLIFN